MAVTLRRAGLRAFTIDGTRYDVVDDIEYNLGTPVREELIGADRFHGYSEKPGTPMQVVKIRDRGDLDVEALLKLEDVTCEAELINGKTIMLRNATQMGDGGQSTETGIIETRWVGESSEEIGVVT